VMDKATVPVLVRVIDCDALVEPDWTEPNERLVADRDTATGLSPVPLREIDCGELPALSVIVISAVIAPAVAGVKCPWMEQVVSAATLAPQLFANTNEEAFAPVTAMLAMARGPVPVLVSVTDFEALVTPTFSLPNDRVDAESETIGGPIPVPLSMIDCGLLDASSVIVTAAVSAPAAVGVKCP